MLQTAQIEPLQGECPMCRGGDGFSRHDGDEVTRAAMRPYQSTTRPYQSVMIGHDRRRQPIEVDWWVHAHTDQRHHQQRSQLQGRQAITRAREGEEGEQHTG
jgi:hypothetical protein